ncbi:FecR family protein [Sphingobium phenoxybenzoativorans]|uniref:FecR family protein n=1 Tax=Sphingobium phenoxybenzoativorans TaxID=1592790 RepID=UPI000871DECD|nr:FecR domain-containing protein [Sphingobium phenoxybenzoativorans]
MKARPEITEQMLDEALAWHMMLEADDADWDGYTAWLEADPLHRDAFDAVALVDAAVMDNRTAIRDLVAIRQPESSSASPSRRWMLGGAVAAAIALVFAVPMLRKDGAVSTYRTAPGESRDLALANGTNVTLSPASTIIVTGKDAAKIELASGEAYFDVRHDPSRTLTVAVNGYQVTDIGTRFVVNAAGGRFHVGVSEGIVSVTSPDGGRAVQINAGQQMFSGGGGATISSVPAADIGSWRSGRLSYSDAPLPIVAADIARYSGKAVTVDPSLEKKHFSGILVIGDGTRLVDDLATVMDIRVSPQKDGYRLGAAASR